jgi:hypothetical protein
MQAVDVVQRQLDAYNARDLERFLAEFHDDVQVFRPPAPEPVISGKAAFAAFYASQRFNRPQLHAHIVGRLVMGQRVIDHERISGLGDADVEMTVVFDVVGERIQTMWSFAKT